MLCFGPSCLFDVPCDGGVKFRWQMLKLEQKFLNFDGFVVIVCSIVY